MAQKKSKPTDAKRIVSSSHLVSEKAAELSEVEYGHIQPRLIQPPFPKPNAMTKQSFWHQWV